jgi:hypothetical protein
MPLFMETLVSVLSLLSLLCIALFFFSKNNTKHLKKLVQVRQESQGPPEQHLKPQTLLWWDYLEGGSKSMADCLDFDENFELGKI